MDLNLETKTEDLPRIGVGYSRRLAEINIKTAEDLLRHFPHRYEDFSDLKTIDQVKANEKVCLQGEIIEIKNTFTYRRRLIITEAFLQDQTGQIKAVWFNQPYLADQLKDQIVILAGKTTEKKGEIYLSNPTAEKFNDSPTHAGRIVPVYSETKGITSRWLRYIIKPLLDQLKDNIDDPLPSDIKKKNKLIDLSKAFRQIHFPENMPEAEEARQRLAFEELFYIQLKTLRAKATIKKQISWKVPVELSVIQSFVKSLPFQLTPGQKIAIWRILKDMDQDQPMSRLLEGDVGSGKTAVMMVPALNVATFGGQTALMAPTSVLARQHFDNLKQIFKDFPIKIGLLTGETCYIGNRKSSSEATIRQLKDGKIDLIVGTHALIQERVKFNKLVFVVIDEQHRFGVRQRARLMKPEQKERPHLLSMTATPIPRTLALTVYGDLDLSLLKEKPNGRKEIITQVIKPSQRRGAYRLLRQEIKKGRQAFVVCPRIESGSEEEQIKTVANQYQKLSEDIFPDLKVARLHGRMKAPEKERVLRKLQKNLINILVTTSVIEVGIDIPNATVMIIEGAERFGLAQLHQMRGRIGRSNHESYCLLFTSSPEIESTRRLSALVKCHDGFKLAEKDLAIRGPGSLTGQNQWGIPNLVMANIGDLPLIEKTRQAAKDLLEEDPELRKHPGLLNKIKDLETNVHFE